MLPLLVIFLLFAGCQGHKRADFHEYDAYDDEDFDYTEEVNGRVDLDADY